MKMKEENMKKLCDTMKEHKLLFIYLLTTDHLSL